MDVLLRSSSKVDSISAQLLLREAYDISYWLIDHNRTDAHPWALVQHIPQEDYTEYGPLYRTIHSYRLRDIHKRFGMNLVEFLDLPREYVRLLTRIAEEDMSVEGASLDDVERQLGL